MLKAVGGGLLSQGAHPLALFGISQTVKELSF